MWNRRSLIALNVLGGLAVLASYALAFAYSPAIRVGLWGGVPEVLQPLYTVMMLLAAAGYFPFSWLLVLSKHATRPAHPMTRLHVLYALVLIPSAMWLPLTAAMIESPSWPMWILVRAVLFGVAAGSTGLMLTTLQMLRDETHPASKALRALAFVSTIPFFVQTGILDALIWPYFYPSW